MARSRTKILVFALFLTSVSVAILLFAAKPNYEAFIYPAPKDVPQDLPNLKSKRRKGGIKELKGSESVSQKDVWNKSTSKQLKGPSTNTSKGFAKEKVNGSQNDVRQTEDYYTCKSEVGRLGYFSDYRKVIYEKRTRWIIDRMSDDYCHCWGSEPLFTPPAKLTTHAKNPCWRIGRSQKDLDCVPYFFLIGFAKSATSDMYLRIAKHPQIAYTRTKKHWVDKEMHWFDYFRFMPDKKSLTAYTEMLQLGSERISSELAKTGKSQTVIGDGTPETVNMSFLWRCFIDNNITMTEPAVTNADVVHTLNPEAKIIVTVRNPADRLYSHYNMIHNWIPIPLYNKASAENFHKLTSEAVKEYSQCLKHFSARHCVYNGTIYAKTLSHLQESMFSVYLRDWIKVFPKEQIFLSRYEEYKNDNETNTIKKIWEFLGLEPVPDARIQTLLKMEPRNIAKTTTEPMWNKTRELLDNFYEPFEKDLEDLIKQGRFTLAR